MENGTISCWPEFSVRKAETMCDYHQHWPLGPLKIGTGGYLGIVVELPSLGPKRLLTFCLQKYTGIHCFQG